jgi:hypothetical protein
MDRLFINMSLYHYRVKGFDLNQLMDVHNEGVHIRVREVGLSQSRLRSAAELQHARSCSLLQIEVRLTNISTPCECRKSFAQSIKTLSMSI